MFFRPIAKASLLVALSCTLVSGIVACDSPVDQAVTILNKAIDELGQQPAKWEHTLTTAIDELGKVEKDVATTVEQLYQEGESYTLADIKCGADFAGTRLQQLITYIRDTLLHNTSSPPPGKVCNISPGEISLQWDATGQLISGSSRIDVWGFDFVQNVPTAVIQDANGTIVRTLSPVLHTTAYHLEVQLVRGDFAGLTSNRPYHLGLLWENLVDLGQINQLAITVPQKPRLRATVTLFKLLNDCYDFWDGKAHDWTFVKLYVYSNNQLVYTWNHGGGSVDEVTLFQLPYEDQHYPHFGSSIWEIDQTQRIDFHAFSDSDNRNPDVDSHSHDLGPQTITINPFTWQSSSYSQELTPAARCDRGRDSYTVTILVERIN